MAFPLVTAEYLQIKTTNATNSNLQACGPIEAGIAGMGVPFYPCPATVQVNSGHAPTGFAGVELALMHVATTARAIVAFLVTH